HLCAVLLRRDRPQWAAQQVSTLSEAPCPQLSRPADVAVAGLRCALGFTVPELPILGAAVRRELAREPLPPAPRAHDDERLMLGVAAAVTKFPELRQPMAAAFSDVRGRSPRWGAIVALASWLAADSPETLVKELMSIIDGFPAAAQLLADRAGERAGIELKDEYDVQWIFHALSVPFIPDLVPEDPAPRLAGKSSRLDFSSKKARLGVEIKHV